MTIVKDGYPAIFGALVVALITYFVFGPIWAVIPGVLALFFLWFFRNPTSMPPKDPNVLYSPAQKNILYLVISLFLMKNILMNLLLK